MATKRAAPHVHPSRQDQVPAEPRRKKRKPDNAGPRSYQKAHPVNDLKSEIRSLKRLLARTESLPADVRVEKERALQTAQHELEQRQKAKQRSEMIGRYHKVRFFDRQKATKRLKRARKELQAREDGDEDRMDLARRVEDAEVDVNYAQYYPLDMHYIPLFPRKKDPTLDGEHYAADIEGNDPAERKGSPQIWQKVKDCMAEGTLNSLRNGELTQRESSHEMIRVDRTTTSVRGRVGDPKAGYAKGQVNDDENGSDGGFFE